MSHTYDDIEDWDEESKDSPLALVGILVMALTSAAIIGNALFMQTKSAELELMAEAAKTSGQTMATETNNRSGKQERSGLAPGGDAVTLSVQMQLNKAGYYVGPHDGVNGAQTREAVRAFEDAIGVPATGKISQDLHDVLMGRITVDAYRERHVHSLPIQSDDDLIQPPGVKPVLQAAITALPKPKPGSRAAAGSRRSVNTVTIRPPAAIPPKPVVKPDPVLAKVQNALTRIGYGNLAVDGLMGAKTSAAIAEFQRVQGHPITGSVNDRLLNDLVMMGYLSRG